MAIQTDRLRERLDALGLNPAKASKLAGLSSDTIRNIMRGQSKNARSDTISALARILQCSVPYLLGDEALGADPRVEPADKMASVRWLKVLHEIGAGYWIQPGVAETYDGVGPVAPSAKYADANQWLERVIGPAANQHFAAGDLIHVISAADIGYAPQVGDLVVLVRRDGEREERSIRRVTSASRAGARLAAPTTDARYTAEISVPDANSCIVGKIVGSYRSID